MGRADYLSLGDFNAICYQCGWKRKASDMEKNWQGYYVCPEHNEPRQPQDFVRAIPDDQSTPWVQPDPPAIYTYEQASIGIGDGVNKTFQFGSGLGSTAVTYSVSDVYVGGVQLRGVDWSINSSGVITLVVAAGRYVRVEATGKETVLA